MPFFSFADGAAMFDSTPIENLFLMEYLPAAPGEYLRVYLYARMLSLHPELGGDLPGMARALRMEEDAVLTAFEYWERQGLTRRLSDRPPTYELLPVRADSAALTNPMERDYYENREFNSSLQALFPDKLLHPQEYEKAQDWVKLMHFDQDAVLLAVKREVENSRSKSPDPSALFRRLDKRMIKWAERGILSAADLELEIRYDGPVKDAARAVAKRLAIRRDPTQEELETVSRWVEEWHFDQAQILEACGDTTKSRAPSFAYLDAILKSRLSGENPLWEELSAALKELNPAGAQPTPDELARYAAMKAAGFDADVIRLAAVQCRRGNRTRFDDVERMLGKWKELGLKNLEDAEAYVRDMEHRTARVRRFLERCGSGRRPGKDDLNRYESWQGRYSDELIDFAAECARGTDKPVKYADKLLSEWARTGIDTAAAARAEHEKRTGAAAASNPALDYAQRQYDKDDFGDDFFFDAVKAYGNGGEGK